MKNCKTCGQPLNKLATKFNRTEHYGCRNARLKAERKDQTSNSRNRSAQKAIKKRPILLNLFS